MPPPPLSRTPSPRSHSPPPPHFSEKMSTSYFIYIILPRRALCVPSVCIRTTEVSGVDVTTTGTSKPLHVLLIVFTSNLCIIKQNTVSYYPQGNQHLAKSTDNNIMFEVLPRHDRSWYTVYCLYVLPVPFLGAPQKTTARRRPFACRYCSVVVRLLY